ncbi:20734_t:CDS:2 [Cetraspora pellucida]|uniref:20734_t:CDS:1 n=1 Tax=Cetraspora pellucida TaxID=1433469 RepID=A0A9N9DUY8_9GLOM|nr:20734_t:CDS:2 [Cetraspora pellucida]
MKELKKPLLDLTRTNDIPSDNHTMPKNSKNGYQIYIQDFSINRLIDQVLFEKIFTNIFGFGNFVEGNDGNCYLQRGQDPEQFIPAGFVMMAIFCWIIFGLIAIRIYMMWDSLNEMKQIRQQWQQILFDDGLFYLGLIALFQTINVIFILASQDFFERFVNVTPALILTSICAKRLIFAKTNKKNNNHSMTAPLNVKVNDNDSFIINDMLEPPTLPISHDRSRNISPTNSINSFSGIPISPPTPIMISDFGPSLTTYFNNITTMNPDNSRPSSKQSSKYSSKYSSNHISNVNNNSRLQVIQPTSRSGSYSSRGSKRSTHTILQSIFRSNRRAMDSDDFYYFRYSEANGFDDDVFLFPAIPPQNPSKSNVKGKLANVNKPLPPKPGFF